MAKFKNISGEELLSGPLGNRLVQPDQVVDVPDALAKEYVWAAPFWEAVDEAPKKSAKSAANDESQEG